MQLLEISLHITRKSASKNGSLMFKHFILLKRTAISPHLEWKDESTSEARANLLMEYLATIYREISATKMSEYIESSSFDLKICKDEIRQFAKKLVTSNARGLDAIPHMLYVRTAGTLFHSHYNVYRNIVRTSCQMEGSKSGSSIEGRFDKGRQKSINIAQ